MEDPVYEAEVKAVVYELKGARQSHAVELRAGNSDVPVEIDSTMLPAELNRPAEERTSSRGEDVTKSSENSEARR